MGLPALLLPERLLDEVPGILKNTGAAVATKAFAEEDAARGFIVAYLCKLDGAGVRVTCQRAKQCGVDYVVIVLDIESPGLPGSRRLRAAGRLLKRIETALRQHGATDLGTPAPAANASERSVEEQSHE